MAHILKNLVCFSIITSIAVANTKSDSTTMVEVNDLGVHGAVFEIEEESLLDVMMKRLGDLQASGKLEEMQEKMAKEAQKRALEPKRLQHLTKTTRHRVFHYDPTLVIESDIKIPKEVQGKEVVLAVTVNATPSIALQAQ